MTSLVNHCEEDFRINRRLNCFLGAVLFNVRNDGDIHGSKGVFNSVCNRCEDIIPGNHGLRQENQIHNIFLNSATKRRVIAHVDRREVINK
jgi:hypothetical protein